MLGKQPERRLPVDSDRSEMGMVSTSPFTCEENSIGRGSKALNPVGCGGKSPAS